MKNDYVNTDKNKNFETNSLLESWVRVVEKTS